MPPELNRFESKEIVDMVRERVGSVGSMEVVTSQLGERFEQVELSRGGVVNWEQSREASFAALSDPSTTVADQVKERISPSGSPRPKLATYHPELVVIKHTLGVEGPEGVYFVLNKDDIEPSLEDSRDYVFFQHDKDKWQGWETGKESLDLFWIGVPEFFMPEARQLHFDEADVIKGLISKFDAALIHRVELAEDAAMRPFPHR